MKLSRLLLLTLLLAGSFTSRSFSQGARVIVQPRSLTFSTTTVGHTLQRALYIVNLDTVRSVHGHLSAPASANFAVISPDTFSLAPRGVDTVIVQFQPIVAGAIYDSIYIMHDGDTTFLRNPTKFRLSGTAVSASDTSARIALSTSVIQFPKIAVDSMVIRTLLVRNTSDTTRILQGTITGIHAPYSFDTGTGSFYLLRGDTAFIRFRFAPKTAGTFYDTLMVSSNADSLHRILPIILVGQATVPTAPGDTARIGLSIQNIRFDSLRIGADSSIALIIRNTSTAATALVVNVRQITPPFTIVAGSGFRSIPQGGSDTVLVRFRSIQAGTYRDSIVITTNSTAENRTIVIPVTGISFQPVIGPSGVTDAGAASASMHLLSNPALSEIAVAITLGEPESIRFGLHTLGGELVRSTELSFLPAGESTLRLPIADLPEGIYMLRVSTKKRTELLKVLVSH